MTFFSPMRVAVAAWAAAAGIMNLSCSQRTSTPEQAPADTLVVAEPERLYGLPIDSFIIETHKVHRNENLANILSKTGMSFADIYALSDKAMPTFDFRTIRAGNTYTLFFSPDSLRLLRHFVYNIDPTNYVVCSFADSICVARESLKVATVERQAGATITTSLWNAITDQGLSPTLALELSDIYAWTVDFFGIEKGDSFRVIYTENVIDSTTIGLDQIKAAVFISHGTPIYAFRYNQDSISSYFDLNGNSLRRAFLKAPLKYSRISSRFSRGRMHPILKIRRPHNGVDYAAPSGTPVHSIGDGQVIAKGWDKKGGGNYIKIRHNSVYTSVYMHLRGFAKGIKNGSRVAQGDLIGYVGSTGMSTGPHLDFRIFMNGKPVDPLKVDAPPVAPVSNDDIQEFINYSDSLRTVLDKIEIKQPTTNDNE